MGCVEKTLKYDIKDANVKEEESEGGREGGREGGAPSPSALRKPSQSALNLFLDCVEHNEITDVTRV